MLTNAEDGGSFCKWEPRRDLALGRSGVERLQKYDKSAIESKVYCGEPSDMTTR
jgi:hypothetical protein